MFSNLYPTKSEQATILTFRCQVSAKSNVFPDIYLIFLTCQSQNLRITFNFRDFITHWKLHQRHRIVSVKHSHELGEIFSNYSIFCNFVQNLQHRRLEFKSWKSHQMLPNSLQFMDQRDSSQELVKYIKYQKPPETC